MANRNNGLLSSKRLRVLLVACLAAVAGVELIWLAGANWALSSGFVETRLNRQPEKLKVEWQRAHTLVPGVISVQGLSARGQTTKQQWYLELDRGRIHVSLAALMSRTLKTYSVRATGLDFRLRKRLADIEAPPSAQFWPPIPGLAVDAPLPAPRERHGKRPWVVDLRDLRVDGLSQVWILPYRLVGRGTLGVDLRAQVRGPVAVDRIVGALREAEILARGSRIAHRLSLDLEASLDPLSPAEVKGLAVMRSLSGSLSLAGESTTSGLLNQMLASFGPIEVGDTGGSIAGTLLVGHGELLEGSHLELTPEDGWLDFLDWRARGEIDASFEVTGARETNPSILTLSLDGVEVVEKGLELPLLEGASVELTAAAGGLDLTQGIPGHRVGDLDPPRSDRRDRRRRHAVPDAPGRRLLPRLRQGGGGRPRRDRPRGR